MVGRRARRDGVECALRQRIVLQHRDLEFQNVRRLALLRLDQFGELRRRAFDRRLQRRGFLCGIALAVRALHGGRRTVTGPMARPGDAARPVRWISVTASGLAETVMRPARARRRAPHRRRDRRRGNTASLPAAP